MISHISKEMPPQEEPRRPKILQVWCELAPVGDNPGLFWIGWARPLTDTDFRSLRRFMVCWRAPDLDKNGLVGLDEGWRITGEGLDAAVALGYRVIIDGKEPGTPNASPAEMPKAEPSQPRQPPELAPVLVKFLRPEIAILGADLAVYSPFRQGEVAAIPFAHAAVFLQDGAVLLYEG